MHWLLLLFLAFGPAMNADRIRSISRMNEAIKAEAKNNTAEAVRLANEAVELDPSHASAHRTLGQLHTKAGRLIDAAAAYRAGREAVPADDPVAVELAYLLGVVSSTRANDPALSIETRKELLTEAVAAYGGAIAADPAHHKAHHRRGRAHDDLDDPDAADADFRRCIRLAPQYSSCFVDLAHLYIDYGFETEAVAVVQAGLTANPKDARMWAAAGRAHFDLRRPKDAIDAYDKAKAIDPDMVDVLFGLGMAHAELRQREESIENLQAFLHRAGADVPDVQKKVANNTIARMQDVF